MRRPDRQETALALDHDAAGVERGRRDERDAARHARLDGGADEFGAGARLAETAPGEEQPDAPVPQRRFLLGPRVLPPIVVNLAFYLAGFVIGQIPDRRIPALLRQRC